MGLFDFLQDIVDEVSLMIEETPQFFRDMHDLSSDLRKTVSETAHDIGELTVRQITGKEDLTTSYDKRDKADAIIRESKRKSEDAISSCHNALAAVQDRLKALMGLREIVYSHLGNAMQAGLMPLPKVSDIKRILPTVPEIDSFSFDFGTTFGLASVRMEAAEDYLLSAKEYRTAINQQIVELERIRCLAEKTTEYEDEESNLLDAIESGYSQFDRNQLSESAVLLHEIAELFLNEVSERSNDSYEQLLKRLHEIID